jgi:hypothetical protein
MSDMNNKPKPEDSPCEEVECKSLLAEKNTKIAETLGWWNISKDLNGKLRGFCPNTKPWPHPSSFNCPKDVPNFVSILS